MSEQSEGRQLVMCLFADLGSEAEAFHRRKNGDGKISRVFGFVHPSSLSSCPLIGAFFQKYFKLTSASLKFYFGVTALVFSFCLCLDHYHRYHQDFSKFVLHKEIV